MAKGGGSCAAAVAAACGRFVVSTAGRIVVGLIGSDIEASFSPALHEREAQMQGLPYVYLTFDLGRLGAAPEDVGQLVDSARRLGFAGLNITHPCKQLVVRHLDRVSGRASLVGAVNTVVFEEGQAVGHNTDWYGFEESFVRALPDAVMDEVVVVGAGGAGTAVAHALLTRAAGTLRVVDIDMARAEGLARALQAHYGSDRASFVAPSELARSLAGASGVVNATPVGMVGHPGVPFDPAWLRPDLWVAEVIYRPLETQLLRSARRLGCATVDGGGMAVFQAVEAFELFTGIRPDAERMLKHLDALIAEHEPASAV